MDIPDFGFLFAGTLYRLRRQQRHPLMVGAEIVS
jgi:hypothetical protein